MTTTAGPAASGSGSWPGASLETAVTSNRCPVIDGMTVGRRWRWPWAERSPSVAGASDPEGGPLAIAWQSRAVTAGGEAGSFADPAAASTTFTCTTAGRNDVILTVYDGQCPITRVVPIDCAP